MANTELAERESDLSKKERLVNAWAAADEDASAGVVADVTGSSLSYAARVKSSIEEGEIDEETLEDARDEALIEEYETRIQRHEQRTESDSGDGGAASPAGTGDGSSPPEAPERWQPREAGRGAEQQSPDAQPSRGTQQSPGARQPPSQPPRQPTYRGQSPRGQPSQQSLQRRYQPPRPPQPPTDGQQQPQSSGGPRTPNRSGERPQGQSDVSQQLRELDDLLATYEAEAQYRAENMPAQYAAPAVAKLFVVQQIRPRLRAILDGVGTTSR